MSLKKVLFRFLSFSYFRSDLTFSQLFQNQIYEPIPLHSKLSILITNCPTKRMHGHDFIPDLRCLCIIQCIRTLYSQNINDFQRKHLMKMVDKMDVDNGMYSTFIEENSIFMEKFFTFMEDHKKSFVRMFFAFGLQMDII